MKTIWIVVTEGYVQGHGERWNNYQICQPDGYFLSEQAAKDFMALERNKFRTLQVMELELNTAKHEAQNKDEPARETQRAKDLQKMEAMSGLISEVIEWHSDPSTAAYNDCDKDPCHWCEMAKKLLESK